MVDVHIDIDRIAAPIQIGVRRAALFMGLGLNAVAREDAKEVALSSVPLQRAAGGLPIDFLPRDPSADELALYKEEFSAWLVGASLRELMEHVSLTLDLMHDAALTVLAVKDRGRLGRLSGNPGDMHRAFVERKGVPEKLQLLRERFAVATPHEEWLCSLYRARNCLTHGLGVVTQKAADSAGVLRVRWLGYRVEIVGTTSGTVWPFDSMIGVPLPEDTTIRLRPGEREKCIRLGEKIRFSHDELGEICLFVGTPVATTLVESFIAFMAGFGIALQPPQLPEAT